jgi:hypothetical protein
MNFHAGLVLPKHWRTPLGGFGALPPGPLHVNWDGGPDCVVGEARIKILGPGRRVLHLALLDDGWEVSEAIADGPGTVELELGADSYSIEIGWEDDPGLAASFASRGIAVPPVAREATW